MRSFLKVINGLWGAILLIGIGVTIISTQYDNYRISKDNNLTVYNIKDIENNGIGTSRYIQINDAIATGDYVKVYNKETNEIDRIIYPVCSIDKARKIANGDKKEKISVMVIDNNPPDALIDINRTTLKGTALVGLDEIEDSTKDLFKSFNLKHNLIVLDLDSTPADKEFSLSALLFGILMVLFGLFAGIGAFISDEE